MYQNKTLHKTSVLGDNEINVLYNNTFFISNSFKQGLSSRDTTFVFC